MTLYIKKPIVVEIEPFKSGMEDGYAFYTLHGVFKGFYRKDGLMPKLPRKPAIQTLEGWYEVEEGKHYIVTGVRGERYPITKDILDETYDRVGDY